jgi:hypothetical protein
MNRYVKALIDRIDVDEHLGHYQNLTHAQRARLLSEMVMLARSVKKPFRVDMKLRKLEERKFTPAVCRKFLQRVA